MALVVYNRVQETTTTTGTGTITLAGAVSGFQSFAVVGNGNTTYYTITSGTAWEVGIGTYTASGTTLARTTILSNSLGTTAAISLTGTSNVFVTYPSEKSIYQDASGNVGIGTASPNVKLDVIGSIEASPAATQDGIILAGRAGGTSSFAATLTPTTLTASRIITLPDATTTMVGTDTSQTLTNKTLTTPVIAQINDASALATLKFIPITSAVNEISIQNNITGQPPHIYATGTDANISLHLSPKGTSRVVIQDGTDFTKRIAIGTGGATTGSVLTLESVATAARTLTFPDATDTLVGKATTDTLTNKRVTPRVLASTANSATPTLNTDLYDMMVITGQSVAITSFTTNLTGTPTNGQKLWISITGTAAIAITWGASFEASTIPLPTTTVTTNRLDVGFVWNVATSDWRCVAVA